MLPSSSTADSIRMILRPAGHDENGFEKGRSSGAPALSREPSRAGPFLGSIRPTAQMTLASRRQGRKFRMLKFTFGPFEPSRFDAEIGDDPASRLAEIVSKYGKRGLGVGRNHLGSRVGSPHEAPQGTSRAELADFAAMNHRAIGPTMQRPKRICQEHAADVGRQEKAVPWGLPQDAQCLRQRRTARSCDVPRIRDVSGSEGDWREVRIGGRDHRSAVTRLSNGIDESARKPYQSRRGMADTRRSVR